MKHLRPLLILALVAFVPCALRAQTSGAFHAGDVLELHVTGVPSEDTSQFGSYVVDDDGMINLPFNIQVKAAGMLPGQIQKIIESRYIEEGIYKHPVVDARKIRGQVVKYVTVIRSDFPQSHLVQVKHGQAVKIYNMMDIERGKIPDPPVFPGDEITVGVPKPAEEH